MPANRRIASGENAVDFFISYTASDLEWAKWVAWELSRKDYSYRLQSEHIPPGSRFIQEMRRYLDAARHVLAILSPAYFESKFASLEMQSAVVDDADGSARRLIPIRVMECSIPRLFKDLVYIDFVGKSDQEARRALIAGVRAAMLEESKVRQEITKRQPWPGDKRPHAVAKQEPRPDPAKPLKVQFFGCDVGRGLDLKGQYRKIKAAVEGSDCADQIKLQSEFNFTYSSLFERLNRYRPHVVHLSGNQNGGDVLLPSGKGGEVIVADEVLAGLLSSLGTGVRLAIIDTCQSYRCAKRVSEVVECALGVKGDILDVEAIRFYEVFYQAVGAGLSIADAHGQAVAALRMEKVPPIRIPSLCVKKGLDATELFLVRA